MPNFTKGRTQAADCPGSAIASSSTPRAPVTTPVDLSRSKQLASRVIARYRLVVLATVSVIATSPALAITCHGDFQVVNGQEISTPFCRDNELARVARGYGFHVSDADIRNSPAKKEETCRFLRNEIRVHTACEEVLPTDGGSD